MPALKVQWRRVNDSNSDAFQERQFVSLHRSHSWVTFPDPEFPSHWRCLFFRWLVLGISTWTSFWQNNSSLTDHLLELTDHEQGINRPWQTFSKYPVRVKIIAGSLVKLENLFSQTYRHRYRLEIHLITLRRYRLGVRTLHFHWFPITILKVIWINFQNYRYRYRYRYHLEMFLNRKAIIYWAVSIRNTPSTAGNSMTGSERPSPEPILKKEAPPAVLGGREFWKRSGSLKCLELQGLGHSSRTLEGNSRKRSESVSGVFPEFFRNFFRKVPAVLGVWPSQPPPQQTPPWCFEFSVQFYFRCWVHQRTKKTAFTKAASVPAWQQTECTETGRIRFRGVRFQTPNSVSFSGLTEFRGANSVSSFQPSICVQMRTHRVSCRTHRVCRRTQWVLSSETVLSKQYSARFIWMYR